MNAQEKKYYASCINKAVAGNNMAKQIVDDNYHYLACDLKDYYSLSMRLEIYANSPEHKKLMELSEHFDTPEINSIEIF